MKFLIESMLILARSDAGVTAATLSPVNFSFLAEQTMATFEPIFFEAGKEISYHIREQVQVNGDEKRLMQLIGILLDNACKYSRPGSVIDVSLTTQGGRDAVFSVTSKGTPLTDADAKRIFDRFYRLCPATAWASPSPGILWTSIRGESGRSRTGRRTTALFFRFRCIGGRRDEGVGWETGENRKE